MFFFLQRMYFFTAKAPPNLPPGVPPLIGHNYMIGQPGFPLAAFVSVFDHHVQICHSGIFILANFFLKLICLG